MAEVLYKAADNGWKIIRLNFQQCECPPDYAGILCEIEKPSPCEFNNCAENSFCMPTSDYLLVFVQKIKNLT